MSNNKSKVISVKDARDMARNHAKQAFALIAAATNACKLEESPYQYSDEDIERLTLALHNVVDIIENGEIHLNRSVIARNDINFQKFKHRALMPILEN